MAKLYYRQYLYSEIETIKSIADVLKFPVENCPDDKSETIARYVIAVDVPQKYHTEFKQLINLAFKMYKRV